VSFRILWYHLSGWEGSAINYTSEEAGLIDGIIGAYFASLSVGEELWLRYRKTHDHLLGNRINQTDLLNIKAALSFVIPAYEDNRQTQRDLVSALVKTNVLLQSTD
jgi:hypothetical protein